MLYEFLVDDLRCKKDRSYQGYLSNFLSEYLVTLNIRHNHITSDLISGIKQHIIRYLTSTFVLVPLADFLSCYKPDISK